MGEVVRAVARLALAVALSGCGPCDPAPALTATGEPWPEADALFRTDPRWLGADDAYSVDLGGGRVLWLFADTFIATSDANVRSESRLIRNSVAVQEGYDPASASITFFWREEDGQPASFFPETSELWYWPGDGERLGDKLLIYLMAVRSSTEGLGFEVFDSDAVLIENPDASPDVWSITKPETPPNDKGVIVGSASVLADGDFLYAFSSHEPPPHDVHLVRFARDAAASGDLSAPEWLEPSPVLEDGQTELTVHRDDPRGLFIEVQAQGFEGADLALRTSSALTGPWSSMTSFYRPPESDRSDAFIYAGKAHPELTGADLVVTYASNSFDFGTLVKDSSLYFPRFVKVTYADQ